MEKPAGLHQRLRGTITCLRMLNGRQSTEKQAKAAVESDRNYHGLKQWTLIAQPSLGAYAGSWVPAAD
ncbi:hypothetical protein N7447_010108 [Penicillium robsamsonii]|uniref:uncharacterized protein n=1 Tax=Penicillium robsamsonii TaxID=1792511 RepID=UPI00254875C4|nr:uncharacterized protein N7447_010108 [Penicillium robsamsonii]KAJ5813085.1 hypothetical protein N7447_010108 [Penicillium robsamsonii]